MAEKASGVYYYLTDSSIRPSGASNFEGLVLLKAAKVPEKKLVTVTARDFEDVLGYPMADGADAFNSAYYGLAEMLGGVARLDVLCLNADAKFVGRAFGTWAAEADGSLQQPTALKNASFDGLLDDLNAKLDADAKLWLAHKSAGYWGRRYARFSVSADEMLPYTVYVLRYADENGNTLSQYKFSFEEDSDLFWKKVSFGRDLAFKIGAGVDEAAFRSLAMPYLSDPLDKRDYAFEVSGSPADAGGIASDLASLLQAIDTSTANVVVTNGFGRHCANETDYLSKLGAIVKYCEKQDRSVLADVPSQVEGVSDNFTAMAVPAGRWADDAYASEYLQLVALWDRVTVNGVTSGPVEVPPSVQLFGVYAKMFRNFGNVCYPPAGPTYGTVAASNLEPSDFYLYGDLLKDKRVNFITKAGGSVCVWEQRTKYGLGGSDLSYANTVYILRDLKGRLVDFMSNYSFRYSTPVDLLTIQSGLTTILESFKRNYFLVNYQLDVPSYEEAQAAGRTVDINIAVSVASDMEVINLRVALKSAADLRAA